MVTRHGRWALLVLSVSLCAICGYLSAVSKIRGPAFPTAQITIFTRHLPRHRLRGNHLAFRGFDDRFRPQIAQSDTDQECNDQNVQGWNSAGGTAAAYNTMNDDGWCSDLQRITLACGREERFSDCDAYSTGVKTTGVFNSRHRRILNWLFPVEKTCWQMRLG